MSKQKIYWEGSDNIPSLWNSSLHDWFLLYPIIILIIFFCNLKNLKIPRRSNRMLLPSGSEVILQDFKKLSFSTQKIAHINKQILQKYAIKIKHTSYLIESLHRTSYVQDKHSISKHKQCLNAVLLY